MAILKKLKAVLDEARVPYEVYNHALAYTAQEIAAKQHIPGNQVAKVVMVDVEGELVMGVVRGNDKLDLPTATASLGAAHMRMASESDFVARFPDCEIGTEPPFGNLFGVKVVVDAALEQDEYIYFNAGNHVQTVRLKYRDFKKLVNPRIACLVEESRQRAA